MFKALIKTRIAAMFAYIFRTSKNNKKNGSLIKYLFGGLLIYSITCISLMFGFLFNNLCTPFYELGLSWLYFAFAGIIAFALCFIGSIFTAQAQLYEAKDNELLLSMPIPPKFILASRMVMLLLLNYFFELMIVIPAGVVYCMYEPVSALGVIFFIIAFLFLPFIVMALSCLIGWAIALINSKMRSKSLITIVFSLLFLFAYFYFFSQVSTYISKLIQNGEKIAIAVKRAVFPAYQLGIAIADQNFISLLLYILCAVIPFVLVYMILSHSFIKIATANKGVTKIKYKEQTLKVSSISNALVKKELKHFISSPMYMLNASLGVVFTVVLAIGLIVKNDILTSIFTQIPQLTTMIGPAAILILCALTATNIVSAPSISLEGKNLWIVQSFPIDESIILLSKVYAHLVICLPSIIFAAAIFDIMLDLTPFMMLLVFLVPILMTIFQAFFGVVVNLKFPKFDWISETVAVKQGLSTMIAMFGSWGIIAIPTALYILEFKDIISAELFILIFGFVLAMLSVIMYKYLTTKGKAVFASLG